MVASMCSNSSLLLPYQDQTTYWIASLCIYILYQNQTTCETLNRLDSVLYMPSKRVLIFKFKNFITYFISNLWKLKPYYYSHLDQMGPIIPDTFGINGILLWLHKRLLLILVYRCSKWRENNK